MDASEYQRLRTKIEGELRETVRQLEETIQQVTAAARLRLKSLEVVYGFAADDESEPAHATPVQPPAQQAARPQHRVVRKSSKKGKASVRDQVLAIVLKMHDEDTFTIADVRAALGGGDYTNHELRTALKRLPELVRVKVPGIPPSTPATYQRIPAGEPVEPETLFGELDLIDRQDVLSRSQALEEKRAM